MSSETRVFFDRAYARYVQAPEQLESIFQQAFAGLEDGGRPLPPDLARSHILPVLKSALFVQSVQRQLAGLPPAAWPLLRPVTASVVVSYVVDAPGSSERSYVTKGELASWHMTPEQLHRLAVENLAARSKVALGHGSTPETGAFVMVEPQDLYAAARILLGIADEIANLLNDDLAIALPAPELFLAVGLGNAKGVAWLRTVAAGKYRSSPDPISHALFAFRRGQGSLEELP